MELEVGEDDLGRGGDFRREGGEDFGTAVNAAGGAELGEVFGEQEVEGFGVLADGGGEELALEGFEVGGEQRVGGSGDEVILLAKAPRSQSETWDTRRINSEVAEDVLAGDAFVLGNRAENVVQRSDPHRLVRRYGYAVVGGCVRIEHDVTAGVMRLVVTPCAAQMVSQIATLYIARNFHATARTSSLRRWRRI